MVYLFSLLPLSHLFIFQRNFVFSLILCLSTIRCKACAVEVILFHIFSLFLSIHCYLFNSHHFTFQRNFFFLSLFLCLPTVRCKAREVNFRLHFSLHSFRSIVILFLFHHIPFVAFLFIPSFHVLIINISFDNILDTFFFSSSLLLIICLYTMRRNASLVLHFSLHSFLSIVIILIPSHGKPLYPVSSFIPSFFLVFCFSALTFISFLSMHMPKPSTLFFHYFGLYGPSSAVSCISFFILCLLAIALIPSHGIPLPSISFFIL